MVLTSQRLPVTIELTFTVLYDKNFILTRLTEIA